MSDQTAVPGHPSPTELAAAVIQGDWVAPWENSAYFAYVRDLSGQIVAVNQAFARKFGRAANAWIGREMASLVHEEDVAAWQGLVARLGHPPYRVEHETRWLTAQGWRWMAWEETALLNASGQP